MTMNQTTAPATTTPAPIARYTGAPCPTCNNAAHHLISASFGACDETTPVSLTRTGPKHAGARSTVLGDIAMRVRYVFRLVFSTREHAAYADTVTLFGAR